MPDVRLERASILLLGAAVDAWTLSLLERVDRLPQVQTFRLQWAMIHAIESALGRAVDVAATVPVRDWPFTRKIWWGGRGGWRVDSGKWKVGNGKWIVESGRVLVDSGKWIVDRGKVLGGVSGDSCASAPPSAAGRWIQMPLVNLLGFKQVWRLIGAGGAVLDWAGRNRGSCSKMIVSYGLIQPHLLAALALRRVAGAKVVAVLTDPPLVYHDEGPLRRVAKWIDRRLLAMLLPRLDGVIALTDALARKLAPGVPAMVMEGIISDDVATYASRADAGRHKAESGRPFTIMYAGQLHGDYGVRMLLDAFARLQGDGYRLWLFGQGSMDEEIRRLAEADARITFFGFQGPEVIFPRMAEADVMVVPRPVDDRIAPYSFPSKLLEYMAMGRIVVSSNLPGIPPDYRPHLVFADPLTPASLAAALRTVADWPLAERHQREQAVREFIWTNKTQQRQGRGIVQFLEQIMMQPAHRGSRRSSGHKASAREDNHPS